MSNWITWALISALLLFRGLLAAVEASLQQVTDTRAKDLAREHPRRGERLVRLKADPERTAAALRSGMVLSGFASAALGVIVGPRLLDRTLLQVIESSWLAWATPLTAALLVALAATLVDVSLRSAALRRPDAAALRLSWVGLATAAVLSPFVQMLVVPLNLLLAPFGTKVSFQPPPPPLETLEKLLTEQAKKDEVDQNAPQLIRSIFELSDKTVRDVMVPRTDVVSIELSTPPDGILQVVAEQNHSRIPVFKEDKDKIVGILHVRDLVPMLQTPSLIVLEDLLRPAHFVPWVKPIGDLLREMQRKRIHMCVVVDEYGGFSGVITLEDILREIVGDIGDEFDEEVRAVERQADGSFVVDAMLHKDEFGRLFDHRLPDGDFETVGGYLSHLAGAIPEVGDRFQANGWTYAVASKDGPRLGRIVVTKPKGTSAERRPSKEIAVRPPTTGS